MFFHELETERLFLKNISSEDRDFMFQEFSNPEVSKYLYDEEPFSTVEEADGIIGFYTQAEPREQHRWILIRKENGQKIGTCGFHCWDREKGCCELGYDLYPDVWKQGYMTEALKAVIEFARNNMQLKRIDAHIYPENVDSMRMAEKNGFRDLGETVNYEFRGVTYVHHVYTLTI